MPTDGRIPIVLAIDVEPDNRDDPPGSGVDATGFRRTVEWLAALRPRLEDATGGAVHFAWYARMDPQVTEQGGRPDALVAGAPDAVESIVAAADVIGLHTHAGRWDAARAVWVVDHADPAWIDHCVTSSAEAYRLRFGQPCREHRFGDRFTSPGILDRLAEQGVRVDLTPEPGQRGRRRPWGVRHATGVVPDYVREPRAAHRAGDRPLWIPPLSSADPAPAYPVVRRWLRRLRYVGQPRHRTLLIDRGWPSPDLFWDLAEAQVDAGAAHLAFVIRSDLILRPGWTGASAVLEAGVGRSITRRLAFVGGEEALARSIAP